MISIIMKFKTLQVQRNLDFHIRHIFLTKALYLKKQIPWLQIVKTNIDISNKKHIVTKFLIYNLYYFSNNFYG